MKINLENKEYELDIEKAKKDGYLREIAPEVFYKIGDFLRMNYGKQSFIFQIVEEKNLCFLVVVTGHHSEGRLWNTTWKVPIENQLKITQREVKAMFGNNDDYVFKKINVEIKEKI